MTLKQKMLHTALYISTQVFTPSYHVLTSTAPVHIWYKVETHQVHRATCGQDSCIKFNLLTPYSVPRSYMNGEGRGSFR